MVHNTKPIFYMLVGIPGCGKTSFGLALADSTTICLSSDAIRKELYGDESCQESPSTVFGIMHERTLKALKEGYNVVYDATNITRKSRRGILNSLPATVEKMCIVIWAPIESCIERDRNRSRTVGTNVIDKMLYRFEAPFYDEGFDSIEVKYSEEVDVKSYFKAYKEALKISHDNPHHTADIDKHCYLCGENLLNKDLPEVVKFAGYVHDIGKPYAKTFVNTRGETTEVAHYYGHPGVGAWISYGLAGMTTDIVTLAWLVSTHMAPFINQKYHEGLAAPYKGWIDALHDADLAAH